MTNTRRAIVLTLLAGIAVLASVSLSLGQTPGQASNTPTPVINGGMPYVSPDGSRIAFVSDRRGTPDIFVVAADGTGELQLTHTPDYESLAGWTANGKQVLFSVLTKDVSTLYAIDPDSKHPREIGSVPGRTPLQSPDGKLLLYAAGTWRETRLMVLNRHGENASQGPQQITDGSSIAWNIRWSPDSRFIAFTGRNDPKGELAVFVMKVDGSGRRQITHIPTEEGGPQWPVWSPDGRQLAIQVNSRSHKNTAHIWIVDVATGESRKIAAHDQPYLDETPSWFPDGKRIAFQSNRTGRMEVWVMNTDGSKQRQVTGRNNGSHHLIESLRR